MTKLADIGRWSPEELARGDWAIVAANLKKAQKELEAATGGRQSWLDAIVQIAHSRANEPLPKVSILEYTSEIGAAAQQYFDSFGSAPQTPATFRFSALWEAMAAAAVGSTLSKVQYLALQSELESIEMSNAMGQDTPEGDARLKEISLLMDSAPWALHPDYGVISRVISYGMGTEKFCDLPIRTDIDFGDVPGNTGILWTHMAQAENALAGKLKELPEGTAVVMGDDLWFLTVANDNGTSVRVLSFAHLTHGAATEVRNRFETADLSWGDVGEHELREYADLVERAANEEFRTVEVAIDRDSNIPTIIDRKELASLAFSGLRPALWTAMKDKGCPNWRIEGCAATPADAERWIAGLSPQELAESLSDSPRPASGMMHPR